MKTEVILSSVTLHHPVPAFFENRKMMMCSMHGKDMVMAPLVEKYLQVKTDLVPELNTDVFGTFSGEVERPSDPIETLRMKIKKGLELSGETLGIGSEGSFGPHPQIPFVPADQEIAMMIDLKNNIEVTEMVTSTNTNFARADIHSMKDLVEFAEHIHFPSHGLILKQVMEGKTTAIEKGIVTWDHLYLVLMKFRKPHVQIVAETDMRAYLNPTRMKVIADVTEKLMQKILSTCPVCHTPGFGVEEIKAGLQCQVCGAPTRLPSTHVFHCQHCHHTEERLIRQSYADPQYCDYCNP